MHSPTIAFSCIVLVYEYLYGNHLDIGDAVFSCHLWTTSASDIAKSTKGQVVAGGGLPDTMNAFIANMQGQTLAAHSVMVGRLAEQVIADMYGRAAHGHPDASAKLIVLKQVAKLAGLLHDVGKVDRSFQDYMATLQRGPAPSLEFGKDGAQIDEVFKKKRFSFEAYPRHEEVSWLLIRRFLVKNRVQKQELPGDDGSGAQHASRFAMLEHAVYWHHAKPLRERESQEKKFGDSELLAARMRHASHWLDEAAFIDFKQLLQQIDALESSNLTGLICDGPGEALNDAIKTPLFKAIYEQADLLDATLKLEQGLNVEMTRTAIRAAVVTADRVVSALSAAELNEYIELGQFPPYQTQTSDLDVLYRQIESMAESYAERYSGDRTERQTQAAHELATISARSAVACLQGPAGCGKTKIALQYLTALGQKKRIFVFVPRTAIGESLFHELVDTYGISAGVEFLSGSKKLCSKSAPSGFETIDTPEHLQGMGNLVITTIDQLCKTMLSHQKIDLITQLADSHVIFDEFHELVELPGIVLLFLEVMRLRQFSSAGTLLVSATPNPQLLSLLKVPPHAVVKVASFNTKPLTIHLKPWNAQVYAAGEKAEPHPFYAGRLVLENGAFVICNTATVAQQASVVQRISGRNVICFHSKFTPKDKSALLGRILRLFGSQSVLSDEVLIAGPIVQASLNISTRSMHTEMCHGENALQRIGRVNRFGTMDAAEIYFYYALGSTDPATGASNLANSAALSSMHQRNRTNAFYRFLAKKHSAALQTGQPCIIDLAQLYAWYDEFHGSLEAKTAYKLDFQSILKASAKVFADNDFDPVQYPSLINTKTGTVKLARNSLRGRSYYILPLALRLSSSVSKGDLRLLWNQLSDTDHLLTDELRSSAFDEAVRNRYFTWSKGAIKPSVLSQVTAGQGIDLLKSMTKATKAFKSWPQLRGKAVARESPVLVCRQKYDDDNLYYFEYAALKVGLIKAAHLAKIPSLRIKTAL